MNKKDVERIVEMSESSCECDVCNCITIINMNYICNDCLELIKKRAKRRGRVEELKRLHKSFSIFHAEGCVELKLIEKRIKELKGEQK